jgi:hypothetical protein
MERCFQPSGLLYYYFTDEKHSLLTSANNTIFKLKSMIVNE